MLLVGSLGSYEVKGDLVLYKVLEIFHAQNQL